VFKQGFASHVFCRTELGYRTKVQFDLSQIVRASTGTIAVPRPPSRAVTVLKVQVICAMRIGFTSIYRWRPHVGHLYHLSALMREAGHEVSYLTCDSDLPACYSQELRPTRAAWLQCTACRAGGIRSFARENVSSLADLRPALYEGPSLAKGWAKLSASTLGRFELDSDCEG
jgi:hypothetical protein